MTPVSVGSMRSVSRGWSGARDRAAALVFWCTGAGCEPIHFRTPSMRLIIMIMIKEADIFSQSKCVIRCGVMKWFTDRERFRRTLSWG